MHKMDARLDHLSLRDLRLLATLLESRSVTRTAEGLGLSQPAASRIVAKLRRVLGDPLLVRTTAGGALTPRGQALVEEVEAAMVVVDRAFAPVRFDPRTATATIRVATTDYGAAIVAAPFAAYLAAKAPGIGLEVVGYVPETFEALARGTLDLALYADAGLPPDFHSLELFEEHYACVVRAGHPVLARTRKGSAYAAPEQLADYPRAVMLYPDGHRMLCDDILADIADRDLAPASLATPFFLSAGSAIATSDMTLCLPARAAGLLAQAHQLAVIPLGGGRGFTYRLVWHERTERDPMLSWIRAGIGGLLFPSGDPAG